jgi:RNA 2',3'-cyclic 3'-phosphodiesterase
MSELPPRLRAFVAVRMSDQIESELAAMIERARTHRDGIAWVRRRNLHVTIKFLGPAVDSARVPILAEQLRASAAATAPFDLRVRRIGAFPDLARPRVIWVGLESDALIALAGRVDEAAARAGFERESRPFSGHLTIGRVREMRGWSAVRARLEPDRERDFGVSRVDSMGLYSSTLAPGGSIYELLVSFAFSG